MHFRNPAPGVAVLILEGERVLLGRRCGRLLTGRWALPGGFVEFDEDFLTAAHREVREETGLEIEVVSIVNVSSNYLTEQLHALTVVVLARPTGGTARPGDDLDALEWVPLSGPWPELAFEADVHILERYRSNPDQGIRADPRYAFSPRKTPSR